MTVGKDVSGLFPDVLQCMQTTSLELKKLIYLYLINYAKSKPELTILAVNTFIKVIPSRFLQILLHSFAGCPGSQPSCSCARSANDGLYSCTPYHRIFV